MTAGEHEPQAGAGPQTGTAVAGAGSDSRPVVVESVVKVFGKVRALDGVSLSVERGETFGLIGPNGSGKTTLIRLLLGLGRPTSGSVRVLGRPMPDRSVARQVGYMTQSSALYNELTVRENIAFFGTLYGLRGRALRERIDETLTLVDLVDRAGSMVNTLSGGMRQRVSLAAALVAQPRLLFLDEPTVGIDPELRETFWEYFGTLNAQGVTILVSTHILDEAARCHRLALLRFGKLLAVNSPDGLRRESGEEDFQQAFLYFSRRETAGAGAGVSAS